MQINVVKLKLVNMARIEKNFKTGDIAFLIFKTKRTFQENMEEMHFKIDFFCLVFVMAWLYYYLWVRYTDWEWDLQQPYYRTHPCTTTTTETHTISLEYKTSLNGKKQIFLFSF